MANGFIQPKQNKYLLASQLFAQAPTTNIYGALSQALAGLTAGIGQRKQQKQMQAEQSVLSNLLSKVQSGEELDKPTLESIGNINPELGLQLASGQKNARLQKQQFIAQQELQRKNLEEQRNFELEKIKQQQLFNEQQQQKKFQQDKELLKQKLSSEYNIQKLKQPATAPSLEQKQNVAQMALKEGVPIETPDVFAGLEPKFKGQLEISLKKESFKLLNEDNKTAKSARDTINSYNRAEKLLDEGLTTYGIRGVGAFGVKPLVMFSPKAKEFVSISSYLVPRMRAVGSGQTSDFDAKMFQASTIDINNPVETNKNIIRAARQKEELVVERNKFLNKYFNVHGNTVGAEEAWLNYLNDNPIFDPEKQDFSLNQNRLTPQQYFMQKNKQIAEDIGAKTISSFEDLGI